MRGLGRTQKFLKKKKGQEVNRAGEEEGVPEKVLRLRGGWQGRKKPKRESERESSIREGGLKKRLEGIVRQSRQVLGRKKGDLGKRKEHRFSAVMGVSAKRKSLEKDN